MTDQTGPGSHALLQTFIVAPGSSNVILSFLMFRGNRDGDYTSQNSLDYTGASNQQARVDILSSGAGAFDVGAGVLANVFRTLPGSTRVDAGYVAYNFNITSAVGGGGTFQLRFAEVDNSGNFQLGVDNVGIDATNLPEPSSFAFMGLGLMSFIFLYRKGA